MHVAKIRSIQTDLAVLGSSAPSPRLRRERLRKGNGETGARLLEAEGDRLAGAHAEARAPRQARRAVPPSRTISAVSRTTSRSGAPVADPPVPVVLPAPPTRQRAALHQIDAPRRTRRARPAARRCCSARLRARQRLPRRCEESGAHRARRTACRPCPRSRASWAR